MTKKQSPQKLSAAILFEDTHLVVLSKPSGLLSQGEHTGDENLVDQLRAYFGRNYVGLVHRLDRNTSGVMVVAKRTKSAQRLTQSLQNGQLVRTYLAWLEGTLASPVQWRHFLRKDPATNIVRVVQKGQGSQEGKESSLTAKPLRHATWTYHGRPHPVTLAEFTLETGRSHQIRVQSAFEGHPLLGDRKYAAKRIIAEFPRIALHSHRIEFPHPMSGETMRFEDPLPPELRL